MLAGEGGKIVRHRPQYMGVRCLMQVYQINIGCAGVEITFSLYQDYIEQGFLVYDANAQT